MRITNNMINLNTKSNINTTKIDVDEYNTQMTSQKKIQNPSDDPVIAIRALRLRSTLNQINQYYEKNIPDAQSWLDITETALLNIKTVISDVYNECIYGATDSLKEEDRDAILKNLKELREQIYAEGNADYAGRTIFTGYKTNKDLVFESDDKDVKYSITEKFTGSDIATTRYIANKNEVVYGKIDTVAEADLPQEIEVSRIRLSYEQLDVPADATVGLKYTDSTNNTEKTINVAVKSIDGLSDTEIDAIYKVGADEAYFIPETGEVLLGSNIAKELEGNSSGIEFTYDKTGFQKGDLVPEHFFDCVETKTVGGKTETTSYTKEVNSIEYTVSFNQTLRINTEASELISHSMKRDIDEMISSLEASISADNKIADIERMLKEDSRYTSEADQKALTTMLEAAKKEKAYADDKVQSLFENNIAVWKTNLDRANLAITDCGSRASRLRLTESRMSSQQTTFKKLRSENEDRDLSDIIIDYTAAQTAYQAALTAASKASAQTLLNFI